MWGRMITAYTCITNDYDNLRVPGAIGAGRYVCFTDRPRSVAPWETQPFPQPLSTPALNARIPKCLPHLLLDTDISIYMDGAFKPLCTLERAVSFMGDADIALYDHPGQNRSYVDERNWYAQQPWHNFKVPDDVERTFQRYIAEGLPANKGWYAGGLVIRKHNERVREFNELWFTDYVQHTCSNDQFALYRAIVKSGVKVATIPGIATMDRQRFGYCMHANTECGDNPKFAADNTLWKERVNRIRSLSLLADPPTFAAKESA